MQWQVHLAILSWPRDCGKERNGERVDEGGGGHVGGVIAKRRARPVGNGGDSLEFQLGALYAVSTDGVRFG